MTPYRKHGTTPNKTKRSDFKTPEKDQNHHSHEKNGITKALSSNGKVNLSENSKPTNFALGALDEHAINTNKYTSMIVNRNQLGNIRQCKYCNVIFEDLQDLKHHVIEHFDSKLSSILDNTKARRCPVCGKKFPSYSRLKSHYAIKHYCSEEDLNGLLLWSELGTADLYCPI